MTSKERVRNAIAKQPVDKTPLGTYLIDCDTISAVIGRQTYLRNNPGYQIAIWEGRRDEMVESMKEDLKDLFSKLDCIDLITFKEARLVPPKGYTMEDPPKKVEENIYADSKGNAFRISPETNGVTQFEFADDPIDPDSYTEEMFSDMTTPPEPDPSIFELLDYLIEEFGEERYIAGYSAGNTALTLLGGMESGMMTLALLPEVVKACNRQAVFRQNHLDQFYIRPGIAGVFMEQDFGGTNSPLVSPDMFRELCHPYLKERLTNVKKYVDQISYHSCGNTMPLMDMIIDAGVDCYESIQTNADGISIDILIDNYRDELCVWGAIPLEVLVKGTSDEARAAVRRDMDAGKRAKGYILGPSHSIAFGTKYENFMAMIDEFEKLR